MKFKKVLLICLVTFMSIFCFAGCASIEYRRAVDGNNAIIDDFIVELDESKINKVAGKNYSSVFDLVENDMQLIVESIKNWKLGFEVYEDLYPAIKDGIEPTLSSSKKDKRLRLTVQFANVQLFGLFYGYIETDDYEYEKVMEDVGPFVKQMLLEDYSPNENYGLFLYKYSLIKENGILDTIKTFEFNGVNFYEKYKTEMHDFYDVKDLDIYESFLYPDDRMYSNADQKEIEQGITWLRWDLSNLNPEDVNMEVYKLAPRRVTWYILALVISIVALIVISIVVYKKRKNEIQVKITKRDVEKR